jgi:selenocysteine-specific elongation factor
MKYIVAGTAGHIDHGKTALVRALTGIDTDRLEEEKRRGISIDLGFAHLELSPEYHIAFIDVPGHEKFIKNMLAGVGGIDFVLFIIAADESIKPQTREHFEICRLLNIRKGILVLTKTDLVDSEILDLVRLEAAEFVKGSFLENAPVIPVSAVTGAGLDLLRAALKALAAGVTPKDDTTYFRLPIDRSFVIKGFGTVVTGTLISGAVAAEQEVELHPASRSLRVRGVEVHGKPAKLAHAGQRTALNLAGIEHTDLHRGMVLTEPGRFHITQVVDCSFELLASAKRLKHGAPVHFHSGTAEVEGEIRTLDRSTAFQPGARTYARIKFREPILLLPDDRFIIRMFSPVVTIGGGVVVDIAPPKRSGIERARTLAESPFEEKAALFIRESKGGLSTADLIARTGMPAAVIEKAARAIATEPTPGWFLDREWRDETLARWRTLLGAHHKKHPLAAGLPKEELRSREARGLPATVFDALLAAEKQISVTGDVVHLSTHRVALKQDEEEALAKIEAAFERAGLAVPGMDEVLASSGVELSRARNLLQILLRGKKLVKIGDGLVFHQTALGKLRELLDAHKGERFAVPVFKDWTGISRKYAIPLLEYLDREHVTRREGDSRLVL